MQERLSTKRNVLKRAEKIQMQNHRGDAYIAPADRFCYSLKEAAAEFCSSPFSVFTIASTPDIVQQAQQRPWFQLPC